MLYLRHSKDALLKVLLPRLLLGLILSCLFLGVLPGQGLPLPIDHPSYELLDRLSLRYGFSAIPRPAFHLGLKPVDRNNLVRLLKTYEAKYGDDFSNKDRFWLQYAYDDNNEWLALPLLGEDNKDRSQRWLTDSMAIKATQEESYRKSKRSWFNFFYPTPANLIETNTPSFFLRLNPILDLRYGKMRADAEDYIYNRRGLELRAGVDERLFVYFQIVETQNSLPNYLRDFRSQYRAVPGAGFVKNFSGFGINRGVDFLNSQGYLSFDLTPHVGVRTGYGQQSIGLGERSFLLSDFSNNYPFLQLNWRVWKLHYQNLFAELTAGPFQSVGQNMPLMKKYLAAHHLSINIGNRLQLGIFEAVVMSREAGFDLAYLNPVIFYRTVEGSLGSPDNVLIGLDAAYQLPSLRLYGQFILDEFKFDELFIENRGWWANKWAYQIGAHYMDAFGINTLDFRLEYNRARPYLYTHNGGLNSYTHFGMPLAHPLGANFKESIFTASYRPLARLQLQARLYWIEQGEDDPENGVVSGQNINIPSTERSEDFGNQIGQGLAYDNRLLALEATYMLRHNLFVEGVFLDRMKRSEQPSRSLNTTYLQLGLRLNVNRRREYF